MAPSGPSAIVAGGRSLWPLPYPRPGERGRRAAHSWPKAAAPRALDGDLRGDHGILPRSRPLPRDRRAPHVRGRGGDQRVHRRVPDPQSRPRSRGRRGPQCGVRPGVQRASREGTAGAGVACRFDPLLARAARARGADRAAHAPRAADHAHLRAGRPRGARDHARAHPLPGRRPHGRLGDRRRDPQLLRGVHGPGADARPLERGDHHLAPLRRAAVRERGGPAVRLRGRSPRRHHHPDGHAGLVAPRPRRADPCRPRPARSSGQARADPDAARDPRASGSSTSTSSSTRSSRPGSSIPNSRRAPSTPPSGSTCFRRGCSPSPWPRCSFRASRGSRRATTPTAFAARSR